MQTNQRLLQQLQQRLNQVGLVVNHDQMKGEFANFQKLKLQHQQEVQKQGILKKKDEEKQQRTQQQIKPRPQDQNKHQQNNIMPQQTVAQQVLGQPIQINCSFDEEILAELEQYAFNKNDRQATTSQEVLPQKKQIYRFDKLYGFCLKKELFEELVDRLKYIRKSILKKENISEDQYSKLIPTSYLILLSQYLPVQSQELRKYKEFEGCKYISPNQLDKFFNEIKFFMRKNDIDKAEIFYEPGMFDQIKVDEEDFNYDSLFDLVQLSQPQIQPIATQNYEKLIL